MKHEHETAQPASVGRVERGVGRPVPERVSECGLTECRGKPKCRTCVAMDAGPKHGDEDFLRGVLIGLQHMYGHGTEVMFRELVDEVGAADLVRVARAEDALDWSGLRNYGYCDSLGRLRPGASRRGIAA